MHNYTRHNFDKLTKKEKLAFIDRLIDSNLDLNKKEVKTATKKQLERYFDNKFRTRRLFEPYELEYLRYEQILEYLQKNNNMIELYVLKYLNEKHRIELIKKMAASYFPLDIEELQQLKKKEREAYAKARFESKWGYLMRVFTVKYLSTEDQIKFIDKTIRDGNSLSKEMVDILKSPAKKHYLKLKDKNGIRSVQKIIRDRVLNHF